MVQQLLLPREFGYDIKGWGGCFRFLTGFRTYAQGSNPNIDFARGIFDTQVVARITPYLNGGGWGRDMLSSYIRRQLACS